MVTFGAAAPIVPAREIEAATAWYARLAEQPWGSREFAVRDGDGNLLTFFEFPERS